MNYIAALFLSLFFIGCSVLVKQGDYVTYTSEEYTFIENSFLNQSVDCIELGEMKQGGFDAKYCVGVNYASKVVQGFIFEHHFESSDERFIGATLSFKAKERYTIECNSETIDQESSGTEYINCMVPRQYFDLYRFIMNSPNDIHGTFRAAVGGEKVYRGVIGKEGKAKLNQFYKDIAEGTKEGWKKRSL